MKVSIITINFNNNKGLERTIKSVQSQSYTDIEHIVIDGGSNDGSVDIIKAFEAKISYWVSEPDSGIYNAMNKGIAQAHGDYCLFLNSGDVLCSKNALSEICESNVNSDIVAANLMVDNTGTITNIPPQEVNLTYFLNTSLPHPSTMIKTSVLKDLNYREDYTIVSDWIFFFEALILKNSTYQHVDKFMSVFYTDGISTNKERAKEEQNRYLASITPIRVFNEYQNPIVQSYISSMSLSPKYLKFCCFVIRSCQWLLRHGL